MNLETVGNSAEPSLPTWGCRFWIFIKPEGPRILPCLWSAPLVFLTRFLNSSNSGCGSYQEKNDGGPARSHSHLRIVQTSASCRVLGTLLSRQLGLAEAPNLCKRIFIAKQRNFISSLYFLSWKGMKRTWGFSPLNAFPGVQMGWIGSKQEELFLWGSCSAGNTR